MNLSFNSSSSLYFKGKIIDSHVHCGQWHNDSFSVDDVIGFFSKRFNNDKDTVDGIVISNLDCIKTYDGKPYKDEILGNVSLLEAAKRDKRLIPFVVCQPGYGNAQNIENLLSLYSDSIKGLKFHPACLDLKADDCAYYPYLEIAQKYNLPCLFHSEVDITGDLVLRNGVSDPFRIYELAKKFPLTPIIMGHMGLGGAKANDVAIEVLLESIENNDAKLYADLAWVDWDDSSKPHIVKAIKTLLATSNGDMTDRILFGSDAMLGVFGEKELVKENAYDDCIADIKNAIKNNFKEDSSEIIDRIFYKNAKKLLKLGLDVSV